MPRTWCGRQGLETSGSVQPDHACHPNEAMNLSIGDPELRAEVVGTSESLGVSAFGGSPSAFHLTPGSHVRRCRPHTRRVGAGEATGRAVQRGAGLEEALG